MDGLMKGTMAECFNFLELVTLVSVGIDMFAADKNCFAGAIPVDICNGYTLDSYWQAFALPV